MLWQSTKCRQPSSPNQYGAPAPPLVYCCRASQCLTLEAVDEMSTHAVQLRH